MTVAGMNLVHSLGITRRKLIPVATNVNAAGANGLNLVGGMFITIASTDQEGNIRETRQLCYISICLSRPVRNWVSCRRTSPTYPPRSLEL